MPNFIPCDQETEWHIHQREFPREFSLIPAASIKTELKNPVEDVVTLLRLFIVHDCKSGHPSHHCYLVFLILVISKSCWCTVAIFSWSLDLLLDLDVRLRLFFCGLSLLRRSPEGLLMFEHVWH